ncbi:MAG: transcriptional regulator [Microscillaceae bacterium]|nr:transcriptional regulator [Microscillaceae bacterium]
MKKGIEQNKSIIEGLDEAFNHKNRVGIMAILVVNDWVEFNTLKQLLNLEDGTLASHLKAFEKLAYIEYKKEFIGRKPRTSYRYTDRGKTAFNNHLNALEELINSRKIYLDS